MPKNKKYIVPYLISVLAVIGAGFMIYLANLHFQEGKSSVCDLSAELSCSVVNVSEYSDIWGIPVSLLGLLYFVVLAFLPFIRKIKQPYRIITLFSIFSLVFSLYLSAVEFFILDSICLFCESSKIIMVIIFALSILGMRKYKEKLPVSWVIASVAVGLVFTVVAYFIQTNQPEVKDYSATAQCLTEKGVTMYGTYWCPSCAKQRKWFGDAMRFIDEIECDPRGVNPQAELCIAKNIKRSPTWIWDQDGEEIKRVYGAQKIEELAEIFECPLE